jgi:diguanylate cyclase (GGDEF)-like protein
MNEKKIIDGLLKLISDLKTQVYDLEKDLIHDDLTNLKTKAFFEEEANIYLTAISQANVAKRREWFGFKNLSFLFFDVDHFKSINDTYGHAIGDVILRDIASAIMKSLREGDTAARWGGEEIVVSLLGADEEDAKHKADEIRAKIEDLQFAEAPELKVTISIGVAAAYGGTNCEELIKRADQALYQAKETGRNRVVAYSALEQK